MPTSAALANNGLRQGKRIIRVQTKQSGVTGISWHAGMNGWYNRWREGGKVQQKMFFVHRYMEPGGKSLEEADAEALRDAIAFRESMIKGGAMKAAGASRNLGSRGVAWYRGCWKVGITKEGKRIHGGSFRPRDETPEEIEQARLAALERRKQLELEHFQIQTNSASDPRRTQKRESGVAGVTWNCHGLVWRSRSYIHGKTTVKNFAPDDLSDESVEAARLAAVQHRRDLESRGRDQHESVEVSSSAVSQPSTSALATKGPRRGKRLVHAEAKPSGVKGINWHAGMKGWYIRWRDEGGKLRHKTFYVSKSMRTSGKAYQEAEAEALSEAVAFRETLVKEGVFKTARSRRKPGSGGVCWCRRGWRVYMGVNGRRFSAGLFRPIDETPEEVERARLAAVERRQLLELEHECDQDQPKGAAGPDRTRRPCESGVAGVFWDWRGMAWCSRAVIFGKQIQKTFRAENFSEESVEAARLAAVRYRADLERRILEAAQITA